MASYFCAPDGTVVHAVAGPVTGSTFLREARWAVEVYNLAAADGQADGVSLRAAVRKAHLARLKELRLPPPDVLPPLLSPDGPTAAALPGHGRGGNAGKVHTLLAAHPLPRLDEVYPIVWERVLNEQRSTAPARRHHAICKVPRVTPSWFSAFTCRHVCRPSSAPRATAAYRSSSGPTSAGDSRSRSTRNHRTPRPRIRPTYSAADCGTLLNTVFRQPVSGSTGNAAPTRSFRSTLCASHGRPQSRWSLPALRNAANTQCSM